ncbi:threonine synthase [Thermogymnomonas acidicola]|nr:threonine synthase [Thermogymnomonas acidicola]
MYGIDRSRYRCDRCGGLLEVTHEFGDQLYDFRKRGVWKYRYLIHPALPESLTVSRNEGATTMYRSDRVSQYAGISLHLKHDGENPTGSFKDRGMTVAVSEALRLGMKRTVCASTGNTAASAASYSAVAGMECTVYVPAGKVSQSKMAQTLAYGARVVEVDGTFDNALEESLDLVEDGSYTLNSINPWRVEGQKTVLYEILECMSDVDIISVPAGNLGNTSAIGKAIMELDTLGLLKKVPRLVAVQAEGAAPFYRMWVEHSESISRVEPVTVASAIRIGNPVSWKKARRAIEYTSGTVVSVSDEEILEAKRCIDRAGIGCEPASAASVAGIRKMVQEGEISRDERVVAILTGNLLKDPMSPVGNKV